MAKKLKWANSDEVVVKYAIKDSHGTDINISSLTNRVDALETIGRFLALWNASTGVAVSNPPSSPYTYKTGDYFRISAAGDRIPTGSSYTTGGTNYTTSQTTLGLGDVVYFDGTTWQIQAAGSGGQVVDVQVDGVSVVSAGVANITASGLGITQATSSVLGLVKLASNTAVSSAFETISTTSGRYYGVQVNESGQLVVNVPWQNTTYTAGTNVSITNGVISATDTTYSIATASTAGLVKSSTTGTTAGRDYNVQVNSDGTMKVNVPWTDNNTTYSVATTSALGLVKSTTTGTTANRNYYVQVESDGKMKVNVPWTDTTELPSISGNANKVLKVNANADGVVWATDNNTNTWRAVQVNGTQLLGTGTSTGVVNFVPGSNVYVSGSGNNITIGFSSGSQASGKVPVSNGAAGVTWTSFSALYTHKISLSNGNIIYIVNKSSTVINTLVKIRNAIDGSSNTPGAISATFRISPMSYKIVDVYSDVLGNTVKLYYIGSSGLTNVDITGLTVTDTVTNY